MLSSSLSLASLTYLFFLIASSIINAQEVLPPHSYQLNHRLYSPHSSIPQPWSPRASIEIPSTSITTTGSVLDVDQASLSLETMSDSESHSLEDVWYQIAIGIPGADVDRWPKSSSKAVSCAHLQRLPRAYMLTVIEFHSSFLVPPALKSIIRHPNSPILFRSTLPPLRLPHIPKYR